MDKEFPGKHHIREKYRYADEHRLAAEAVGAYHFRKGLVSPMEISMDEGIIATTFDSVINELNESSFEIASLVAEAKQLGK